MYYSKTYYSKTYCIIVIRIIVYNNMGNKEEYDKC